MEVNRSLGGCLPNVVQTQPKCFSKMRPLKTKLRCLKPIISLLLSSAGISKACGLVSMTNKKYFHLNYRTCTSQVHSQTTFWHGFWSDPDAQTKFSLLGAPVAHATPSHLSWIQEHLSRSTPQLKNKVFPPTPDYKCAETWEQFICWLFSVN